MNLVLVFCGIELLKVFLGVKVVLNGGFYLNNICFDIIKFFNLIRNYFRIFCFDDCGSCLCLVVIVVDKEIKVG